MAEKKASAGKQDQPGYECDVCGFRVLVDEECGCVEEHVLLCCGEPMTETGGEKAAPKKAAKKPVQKPAAKKTAAKPAAKKAGQKPGSKAKPKGRK